MEPALTPQQHFLPLSYIVSSGMASACLNEWNVHMAKAASLSAGLRQGDQLRDAGQLELLLINL